MPKRKLDNKMLNIRRLELVNKGFLNQKEISEFVPCGANKASNIYYEIRKQIKLEGLENLSRVILVSRLLKYCGLSVNDIKKAAEIEKGGYGA